MKKFLNNVWRAKFSSVYNLLSVNYEVFLMERFTLWKKYIRIKLYVNYEL